MMVILIQRDIGMEDEASKSPSSKTLDFVFYFFFFFFIKMKKKKQYVCVYILQIDKMSSNFDIGKATLQYHFLWIVNIS